MHWLFPDLVLMLARKFVSRQSCSHSVHLCVIQTKINTNGHQEEKIISDRRDKADCINLLQCIAVGVIYLASVLGLSLIKACADSSPTNLGFWMSVLDNCCVILLDCIYDCMNSQENFVLEKLKEDNTSEQRFPKWIVDQFSVGHWIAEKDHNNAEICVNLPN